MFLKMVSVAVLALVAGMGAASAQSAKDFGGPRELPPASYKGQQYVDSRGCVFLRAGFGGQTNWVPRVSRDRRQLCGYPPSGRQVAVAETPQPAPKAAGRKPIDTVASITTAPSIRAPAPPKAQRVAPSTYAPPAVQQQTRRVVVAPQAPTPQRGSGAERVPTVAGKGKIGCYADAPVAERFAVRGGGSIVMCTRGDGDLTNARAPRLPGGRAAVAPSGFVESHNQRAAPDAGRLIVSTQNVPPKGFKNAWDDDRLNPRRGQGTAQGWYDQDGVWTRERPARLVEEAARDQRKQAARQARLAATQSDRNSAAGNSFGPDVTAVADQKRRKLQISSKSEAGVVKGARSYIQVGTFGQPSNAQGASGRLAGLGLPVARQTITKGGKALQIVLAGPFASGAEAQAALGAARRAGFSDAFIR